MTPTAMFIVSSLCQTLFAFKPHDHPLRQVGAVAPTVQMGTLRHNKVRSLPTVTEVEGGKA